VFPSHRSFANEHEEPVLATPKTPQSRDKTRPAIGAAHSQALPRNPPTSVASVPNHLQPAMTARSVIPNSRVRAAAHELGCDPESLYMVWPAHQQQLHASLDDDRHRKIPLGLQVATIGPPPGLELVKVDRTPAIFIHFLHG
jgi:hypothetical protein